MTAGSVRNKMAAARCAVRCLWINRVLSARISTRLTAQPANLYSSESGGNEQKLCKGINYFKEGSDPPLLPDSEYPEWLWDVLQPKQPIDEESADFNNKTYWRRLRKMQLTQANDLRKKKK